MKSNIFALIFNNLGKILLYISVIIGAYFVYKDFVKIRAWFSSLFNKITISELPTKKDLVSPSYVIDNDIIRNYVDTIYSSVYAMGTNEIELNKVYQNLLNTDIKNTVAVWNEWNKRNYKYRRYDGTINNSFGSESINLYEILKSELTGFASSASENNVFTNYSYLFRKAGLIA